MFTRKTRETLKENLSAAPPCVNQGSRSESAAAGGVRLDSAHADGHDAATAATAATAAPTLDSASREIAEVVFSPQAGGISVPLCPAEIQKEGEDDEDGRTLRTAMPYQPYQLAN